MSLASFSVAGDFLTQALNEASAITTTEPLSAMPAALLKWGLSQTDPLVQAVLLALAFGVVCYVLSILTGDVSMVDRLWSIVPWVHCGVFAQKDLMLVLQGRWAECEPRLVVMFAVTLLWGIRLTFNYARKGGYTLHSGEDYRWPYIRSVVPAWAFQIFNITFIAFYQHILLMLIAAPAYIVYLYRRALPWTLADTLLTAAFLTLLTFETIADQQQWNFQNKKRALREAKKPLTGDCKRGFLTRGLFRFSRHPNFFCELSMWWVIYGFSVVVSGVYLNWSIIGTALLTSLFQGSTWLTEMLSRKRYPEYAEYCARTSRLLPFFPGKPFPQNE